MALDTSRKVAAYAIGLGVISTMLAVGVNISYTKHSVTTSDQKWCSLLLTLDEAYGKTPPTSETGRKVADEIHRLRVSNRC